MKMYCCKCRRRVQWTPNLISICVECHDAMTDAEREALPQEMWEQLHSKGFLEKWPTPAAFDARTKATVLKGVK